MKTCKRISLRATTMLAWQLSLHLALAGAPGAQTAVLVRAPGATTAPTLPAGSELSVRTLTTIDGETLSRGQPVRAMVMSPYVSAARVLIAPRTVLEGTVENTGTEQDGGKRQYVQLRFTTLSLTDGTRIPITAIVTSVDNSRETADSTGRILGPPKSSLIKSKADWGALALGSLNPIGGAVFFAAERGETDERHRKIDFPVGIDFTVKLTTDVVLTTWPTYAAPDSLTTTDSAHTLLSQVPLRALAVGGKIPGDFVNIIALGSGASLRKAFTGAGWDSPDRMSTKSDFDTFIKTAEGQGYAHQPVSQQLMFGRAPDLVFQRVTDTFAKRHHVRLWRTDVQFMGQPVWVAAATHDIGIEFSKAHRSFTHSVASAIDDERDKIVNDLVTSLQVARLSYVQRAPVPENAARGDFASDWRVALLSVKQ